MDGAPPQQQPRQQQDQWEERVRTPPQQKSSPLGEDATLAAVIAEDGVNTRRRSLVAQVASTISSSFHFLAKEALPRSSGAQRTLNHGTNSCTRKASPRADEPPLTHARPPASQEEVEGQLDKVLYAIGQLQQLQQRGRYIASTEVKNLRRAFLFAVGEEQRYQDAVAAHGKACVCSSTSTMPPLPAQRTPPKAAIPTAGPTATGAAPWDGQRMPSLDGPGENVVADAAEIAQPTEGKREYSPKATAADRLLAALERYVDKTPSSTSFDVSGACFSWGSVIHTPGERRLQSLTVSIFTFFTGIPICIAITALLLLSRYTAPLMVLYFLWIFTFGRPSHPLYKSPTFLRLFFWRHYCDYFPVRLIIPKPVRRLFDREGNYFFVYHPHGIHSFGAIINFGLDQNDASKMLNGITIHLQTLGINLYIPLWRQLAIWAGCGDASASCIRKTLRSGPGQSIMLVVGGAEESLMAKPNRNDLLLFKRKGFIKIALQEGTPLVPVYGFGENNVYGVPVLADEPWMRYLMDLFKHFVGFAIPLVCGRGFFNFNYGPLPHRRPIVVVVGEPLVVPHIPNPTKEDLEAWQGKYIECLRKLYNDHRGIYDLESTGLRIMQ
ncbi:diacylglycerol acyltransferase, putative [Leishmania guyanensis]|uniref:diacylglycerol O-acyltransferase n=1 Tax=Leishmania guyanensis TaxID=5670 RepID=A0A1E1IY25_LEIGU|nr:hypothetical protein, conserved [Leishmania guyanensis]